MKFVFILLIAFITICSKSVAETPSEQQNSQLQSEDRDHFDRMIQGYVRKINSVENQFNPVIVSFDTLQGKLDFRRRDIRFGTLSSGLAAWIKIGKENSSESGEAISSWIQSSRHIKTQRGFKVASENEEPSEYGSAKAVLMTRGDDYFLTYFESRRMLQSYGRHSIVYTYYIEIGKTSRRQIYTAEQSALKLGE